MCFEYFIPFYVTVVHKRDASSNYYLQAACKAVYTGCPTGYRTQNSFNNSNTKEDIATKFEQE